MRHLCMKVSLGVHLLSNLILHALLLNVIIVIPLIMILILVHYLVDHIYLSLCSPTPKVRSYEYLYVKSGEPIPLGHDFRIETRLADLKKVSDPSSPLPVAPSLDFGTISDTFEG